MNACRPWLRSAALVVTLALASAPIAAQTIYSASLSGPNESPPNASPGTGFGLFTLSADGLALSMNVTFSGLIGATTAAHIHCCVAPPGNVGVATTTPSLVGFPLGVMGGTFVNTLDLNATGSFNPAFLNNGVNLGNIAAARATLISGLNNGTSYFNIHTSQFAGGEIRGFITAVPEPSTVLLLASGLLAVGVVARRRSRQG